MENKNQDIELEKIRKEAKLALENTIVEAKSAYKKICKEEHLDSAKKNIIIMHEQLKNYINNNTMNDDAELSEDGLVMVLDILRAVKVNDEILEKVMQYLLTTFGYDISSKDCRGNR
ncbi:MAG: hypothetical protein KAJ44_00790 [Thermoplasmatales archaeon]|nr:hypothetical protein [Thermoplasmatales archaeon]